MALRGIWSRTRRRIWALRFLLLIAGLAISSRSSVVYADATDCPEGFYVVASPVGVPGRTSAVIVTPNTNTPHRNVTQFLIGYEKNSSIDTKSTFELNGGKIIPVQIPSSGVEGDVYFKTDVNCVDQKVTKPPCQRTYSHKVTLRTVRDVIVQPDRKHVTPGDTVRFWILAFNHDYNLPADTLATVAVKDPAATDVAVWEDVALGEGVKNFSFTLSPGAALGNWWLEVSVDGRSFGSNVSVSMTGPDDAWSWGWGWSWTPAPSGFSPAASRSTQTSTGASTDSARGGSSAPDIAMAEEHFVELRFGATMRRVYKPGLPFVGKVEALSSELSVRVRVKLYDNTTAIYSQDVEISSGEATFVVPAIIADSDVITIQAELVSVDGKEIDAHYVLAREQLYLWKSSVPCYLLVEGLEKTMKVGEVANVRVLSTCPCQNDLFYVVTSQDHMIGWGKVAGVSKGQKTQQEALKQENMEGGAVCSMNLTFSVQSSMAPLSRLLVYYGLPSGELITDLAQFDVKLVDKKLSLSFEQKQSWAPGEAMGVEILAESGALVCLVGGRPASGTAVENNEYQIYMDKFSPHMSIDFGYSGLTLHQRQCSNLNQSKGTETLPANTYHLNMRKSEGISDVRQLQLDQLWMWKCFNYTDVIAAEGVSLKAPEGAGKWTMWALSLSSNSGLRFSESATFTVFRPLGVDFRLPRSIRVGELLEVGVKIANNLNSCVDVSAVLSLKEGAHFQSSGLGFVSERLRLGPHGATSLVIRVQATAQSINNLTAEVVAHAASNCQAPASYGPDSEATAKVVRSAEFIVEPEGLLRQHTESVYFCANEHMILSTTENFQFEFIPAPRNRKAVVMEIRGAQGARIAVSDDPRYVYQIAIGDADNTVSWIGRGKLEYAVRLVSSPTPQILSANTERTFWVSWDHGTLAVGRGAEIGSNSILNWPLPKQMDVKNIGFASSWGQTADFRIWNYNHEAGFSQVLHLDIPHSVVPGSEQGTLLVAGGVALPGAGHSHSRSGDLLRQSHGETIEQPTMLLRQPADKDTTIESSSLAATVAMFAPLPGLRHLSPNTTGAAEYQQKILDSLRLRLQELLSFRRRDGSFGDHHRNGSHRSTVTVLELLKEAQIYLSVDSNLVTAAKRWIQSRQEDDGSFSPQEGDFRDGSEDVFPDNPVPVKATTSPVDFINQTALNPELDRRIETTAEALIALLEVGVQNERDSEAVLKARYFLERSVFSAKDPVALSVMCYALVLARSDVASAAVARLRAASTNQEGDFSWPSPPIARTSDMLLEEGSDPDRRKPLQLNVREFRASLYALLAHCAQNDLSAAEPVARYLFYRAHLLDIHPELSYLSVKAFSAFGERARDQHRALTMTLATSRMELTDTIELRPGSPPSALTLPSLPAKVFVYATGAGCATVQGQVRYSTYLPKSKTQLLEIWAAVEEEVSPPRNSLEELEGKLPILRLKTCFRWKGQQPSGILLLDVTLFSGFELLTMSPIALDQNNHESDVHYGSRGDRVWIVLSNVTSQCAVCSHFTIRSTFVVSGLRPAFARVYPAARSDLAAETFFHTRRGSPLLAGISENDIVTWFGRSEDAGERQANSIFKGVNECGAVASSATSTSVVPAFSTPAASVPSVRESTVKPTSTPVYSQANTLLPTTVQTNTFSSSSSATLLPASSTFVKPSGDQLSTTIENPKLHFHYFVSPDKNQSQKPHEEAVNVDLNLLSSSEKSTSPIIMTLSPNHQTNDLSVSTESQTEKSTVASATLVTHKKRKASTSQTTSSPLIVTTIGKHQTVNWTAETKDQTTVPRLVSDLRPPVVQELIIVQQESPEKHAKEIEESVKKQQAPTPRPANLALLNEEQRKFYKAHQMMKESSRKAHLQEVERMFEHNELGLGHTEKLHSETVRKAINTPILVGKQPLLPKTTQEPETVLKIHPIEGSKLSSDSNPLWGLLREVVGAEGSNPTEAEVVGTISEETKDEEQQDEDEEKLTFD